VYGLPVLSTEAAADGIIGLSKNVNIFLVTDAQAFTDKIIQLISKPNILEHVATNARTTYDKYYSRYVAAGKLSEYLERYF
jgi:glycosyltransferase involved in cell wall biosynthesis